MKAYTDITVLLDRSGSMSSIKEAMQTAFNTFLEEHKSVPSTRITLIQFDDHDPQEIVYQGVPVAYAEKLVLRPRGNTPLFDAFCTAIDNTGKRLANLPESERPDQVLMVVITDGEENASRTRSQRDVYDRVTKQRENYNWQFIYLGANQDAIGEAARYNIPHTHALNYTASISGTRGMASALTANTIAHVHSVNRGTAVPDFNDYQRKEAENE